MESRFDTDVNNNNKILGINHRDNRKILYVRLYLQLMIVPDLVAYHCSQQLQLLQLWSAFVLLTWNSCTCLSSISTIQPGQPPEKKLFFNNNFNNFFCSSQSSPAVVVEMRTTSSSSSLHMHDPVQQFQSTIPVSNSSLPSSSTPVQKTLISLQFISVLYFVQFFSFKFE